MPFLELGLNLFANAILILSPSIDSPDDNLPRPFLIGRGDLDELGLTNILPK